MPDPIPLPGSVYGAWRVKDEPVRVGVECTACGATRRIRLDQLQSAAPGPCQRCRAGATWQDRGGESAHPLYRRWRAIIRRCSPDASPDDLVNYYQRGIRVCDEWLTDWPAFRDWGIASGFREGLQIDRRDNDGNYTPENCRWVRQPVNQRNTRRAVIVEAFGERKALADWMDDPRVVVDYPIVYDRLHRSTIPWSAERALTTPRRPARNNATEKRGPGGTDV